MTSLLDDAFAHHTWATERLIDACATITREQLVTSTPGTYGPIMATPTHLVSSNGWYLSFFRELDLWAYGEATDRTRVIKG